MSANDTLCRDTTWKSAPDSILLIPVLRGTLPSPRYLAVGNTFGGGDLSQAAAIGVDKIEMGREIAFGKIEQQFGVVRRAR
ncbi:MAG: hypothetical protein D6748_04355 [Calditrichaeota bacterium]|nr:MAG: hypothetical protein D6748_04355 [Calditrichota bacterium]